MQAERSPAFRPGSVPFSVRRSDRPRGALDRQARRQEAPPARGHAAAQRVRHAAVLGAREPLRTLRTGHGDESPFSTDPKWRLVTRLLAQSPVSRCQSNGCSSETWPARSSHRHSFARTEVPTLSTTCAFSFAAGRSRSRSQKSAAASASTPSANGRTWLSTAPPCACSPCSRSSRSGPATWPHAASSCPGARPGMLGVGADPTFVLRTAK